MGDFILRHERLGRSRGSKGGGVGLRALLLVMVLLAAVMPGCARPVPSASTHEPASTVKSPTSVPSSSLPPTEPAIVGPQVFVAANDSSKEEQAKADFVCKGAADEILINLALSRAAGGRVKLAKGTFLTSGSIIIPGDTQLEGSGWESQIRRVSASSNVTVAKAVLAGDNRIAVSAGGLISAGQTLKIDDEYMYVLAVSTGDNVTVVMRGYNASSAGAHSAGRPVNFAGDVIRNALSYEGGARHVSILSLWVDGGSLVGLRESPGITVRKCDDSVVKACWVQNVSGGHPKNAETDWLRGGGIQIDDSDNVLVTGSRVTGTSHAGISVRNNCHGCTVSNNQIFEVGYEGIIVGNKTFADYTSENTTGEGCSDIKISNNDIRDAGMLGGSLGVFVEDQARKGVGNPNLRITVSNNTIRQTRSDSKMGGIAVIKQPDTAKAVLDCRIVSNNVSGVLYDGIAVTRVSNVEVTDNIVKYCRMNGIKVAYSDSIVLTGNTSSGNSGWGVDVYQSRGFKVSGNLLPANMLGTLNLPQ
jgi:parallel beta-helix repeat protein